MKKKKTIPRVINYGFNIQEENKIGEIKCNNLKKTFYLKR